MRTRWSGPLWVRNVGTASHVPNLGAVGSNPAGDTIFSAEIGRFWRMADFPGYQQLLRNGLGYRWFGGHVVAGA
jgi:hypothetical protein